MKTSTHIAKGNWKVELLTWIILGLVGLGLLVYLVASLIRPEKW